MHLVLGSDAGVAAWVAQRIPQMQSDDPANAFGPCIGVGVASEDGKPLGGVIFHDWQPRFKTVQASFASDSPRWMVPPRHKPAIGLGCEDQTNGTPSLGDQRPGSLSDRIEGIVPNGQAGP